MALTDAEKQKAYRKRVAAKEVAERLFGGNLVLTKREFLDGIEPNWPRFDEELEDLGEASEEFLDEKAQVWEKAFEEAWKERYDEAWPDIFADARLKYPDDEESAREEAHQAVTKDIEEAAREDAGQAVEEWLSEIEDYEYSHVTYSLENLLDAYRAVHGLME